jgi:hypothetical protein
MHSYDSKAGTRRCTPPALGANGAASGAFAQLDDANRYAVHYRITTVRGPRFLIQSLHE